jgi:hypothetical protein
MRHEDASAAIETVRQWFGGALSQGEHVDAKLARLISAILEAERLHVWLHDNGDWRGNDSQDESVKLAWDVVRACDIKAIQQAIDTANGYADTVKPRH